MGRNLKGKELGEGIYQQANGTYCARFIDRFGKRKSKRSKKLQEVRQWLADATYINEQRKRRYVRILLEIIQNVIIKTFRR